MKNIIASDQSYQSIYINSNADNWQEAIVFHEPIFDDEIPGVIALKSLRLEDCLGFVLAAPKSRLRYFREKIKDLDANEQLGKKKPRDILNRLLQLSEEIDGTVVYIQEENLGVPKEHIDGTKPPEKKKKEPKFKKSNKSKQQQQTDSFFDPLTKRELVTKGPQYFDPSLPSMDKVEKQISRGKALNASLQLIQSPDIDMYPDSINEANTPIWNDAIAIIKTDGFPCEDNKNRWVLVCRIYEDLCKQLELRPYKIKALTDIDVDEIKNDIRGRMGFAAKTLQTILPSEKEPIQIKLRLKDVVMDNDSVHIISNASYKSSDGNAVLSAISNDHGFKYAITSVCKNVIKQLDSRTNITISALRGTIIAYVTYTLPLKEAERLLAFNTNDPEKIRFGVMNIYKGKLATASKIVVEGKRIVAITEEKVVKLLFHILPQEGVDPETVKDLIDEIKDKKILLTILEKINKLKVKYPDLVEHIIASMGEEYILEKINANEASIALLWMVDDEYIPKLKLTDEQVKQIPQHDWSEAFFERLFEVFKKTNDSSNFSDIQIAIMLADFEDIPADNIEILLKQKRIKPCIPYILNIFNNKHSEAFEEAVIPFYEDIMKEDYDSGFLMLVDFSIGKIDELLPIAAKHLDGDKILSFDTGSINIVSDLIKLYRVANEENQKLDLFYIPFEVFSFDAKDDDGESLLISYYNDSKNTKYLTDTLIKKIKDEKITSEGEFELVNDKALEQIKDTPIWNYVWDKFDIQDDDDFIWLYKLLTPEQKKTILDDNGYYHEKNFGIALYGLEPAFEEKAVDVAIDQYKNNKDDYFIDWLTGVINPKVLKELYEKLGPLNFMERLISDSNFSSIADILDKIGIKPEDIDPSQVPEKSYGRFLLLTKQYKKLYETVAQKDPEKFLNFLVSTPLPICSAIGIKNFLNFIKDINDSEFGQNAKKTIGWVQMLEEIKPLFEKEEVELSKDDFEYVLNLYEKDADFCMELINELPDEMLKHFEDSKNSLLRYKALAENPRKFLNFILSEKQMPAWISYKLFDKLPPKLLREFASSINNNNLSKLDGAKLYIVRNLFPDEYLSSNHAWAFADAPQERKNHFIDVVGEDTLKEQLKEKDFKRFFGDIPRFERPEKNKKLPAQVIEDKAELFRLILPLAKPAKG